jgi:hypothetical protein
MVVKYAYLGEFATFNPKASPSTAATHADSNAADVQRATDQADRPPSVGPAARVERSWGHRLDIAKLACKACRMGRPWRRLTNWQA